MNYLDNYINRFRLKGKDELAESVSKTARHVGDKYLKKFDFSSDQIGLLFGNIQSGKTGQVFGIACEAADDGFSTFLLLTTDNKLLQEQTYERARNDLTDFVVCSEDDEQKFRSHGADPVLIVLKKNTRILKSWAGILRNSAMLKGNPLFIIDDEADAASLNTKVNQDSVSSINRYLSEIRDIALASIYLQVTGTPQSLLLQTQESNWHPLFTQYFEPGRAYVGGDYFFPVSPNDPTPKFIRFVDDETPSESASRVVLRHLIVSAQTLLSGIPVSNCLIHPGIVRSSHSRSRKEIENGIAKWTYDHESETFLSAFDREYSLMHPVNSIKKTKEELLIKVNQMLRQREFSILTLNGTSSDGSSDYESGCNFIIGGTNLGRGVTFRQLNTFYYTRSSKHPQADTMWQHSRMFGYDRDPGLVTMFSSRALYKLFSDINSTNNAIINQVKSGQRVTIAYPEGLNPTRTNVLDKSLLNILVGGSNHFPLDPVNESVEEIDKLVQKFGNHDPATEVSLKFIVQMLGHIKAEDSFGMDAYIDMITARLADNPLAQGYLLVRRDRSITRANRALLSPDDWAESNQYEDKFVLTLYRVIGQKEKGWAGHPVWVPNIKLPNINNYYII